MKPSGRTASFPLAPLVMLPGIAHRQVPCAVSNDAEPFRTGVDDRPLEEIDLADELGDEARLRLEIELARRRLLHDLAAEHHRDAVGHRQRLELVMRDIDRGDAELAASGP